MKTDKTVSPASAPRPWEGRTEPDIRVKRFETNKAVEFDIPENVSRADHPSFDEPDLNIIS